MTALYEDRQKEIRVESDKLNAAAEELGKQIKELNRKLSDIFVRQKRLEGAYMELEDLKKIEGFKSEAKTPIIEEVKD